MIKLVPSKDPNVILKFVRGQGILRKCSGGAKIESMANLGEFIKSSKAIFLVAIEDNTKGLGFVMLNPEGSDAYSIHLCLRTVGPKTKKIVALAINYAQLVLGAFEIHAVYPSAYRACSQLSKYLGFRADNAIKSFYKGLPADVPYNFEVLKLGY